MPRFRSSLIVAGAAGLAVAALPVAASSAPGFSGRVAVPKPVAVPPAPCVHACSRRTRPTCSGPCAPARRMMRWRRSSAGPWT